MAFKMKSPLYNSEDKLTKIAFGSVPVATGSSGYGGYQSQLKKKYMASKDSGVGAYPDPQTNETRYYDKKFQTYNRKEGIRNVPGMGGFSDGKWVSADSDPKRGTTTGKVNITKPTTVKTSTPKKSEPGLDLKNQKSGNLQIQDFGGDVKNMSIMGTAKGDKALQKGKHQLVNKTYKGDNTKTSTNKSSKMPQDKYTGGVLGNNKGKNTKPSSSSKTAPRKPIRSSDSDKGTGYFNDKLSLGVDTKINVAPMPKFERTVTNARSADYDLVRAKGRGRTSRLKSRLDRRQGRVENRVDRSLARIDARQQRAGTKYAGKMKAAQIKSDKGKTDPGYFDQQKKLDNVGIRGSESPKVKTTKPSKTTLASGETFINTPKKSTKRYMS